MERYEIDVMLNTMLERAEELLRKRAKIVKVMGKYYFKRMEDQEYKDKFPKFCQVMVGENAYRSEERLA